MAMYDGWVLHCIVNLMYKSSEYGEESCYDKGGGVLL